MRVGSLAIKALTLFAVVSTFTSSIGTRSTGITLARAEEEAHASAEEVAAAALPKGAEKYAFQAEVHRMLDIVINSLYQNNDIFLRELISNASDALDKIRYLLLTEPEKYKDMTAATTATTADDLPLEVKITYDVEAKSLTIRDTGVGMTHDDMVQNLGTVARSGTTKFMEALKASGNDVSTISQIGQFGVGFYSAFLVADKVTVASKHPSDPIQHVWECNNGSGDFVVYDDPRGNTLERGTQITLHLKEDALEYANPERLRELAHHYSEFVIYPISLRKTETMEVEIDDEDEVEAKEAKGEKNEDEEAKKGTDGEAKDDLKVEDEKDAEEKPKKTKEVITYSWEVLNSNQAIWTREKEEISDEEYQSFWQLLSSEQSNATEWVHFNAEGSINFKSILYLPGDVPMEYKYGQMDTIPGAVRLYVRKVLIGDQFDLLPKYLGFIRGVVDSDDLPLNVNRETLQESKILKIIKKKLVRKAIDLIRTLAKEGDDDVAEAEIDADGNAVTSDAVNKYDDWYRKFSPNIKLGVIDDEPNRARLMKLLRFETSKSDGKLVSLDEYVKNMKDWQKEIFVLGGISAEEIEKSPFLESAREKDVEVIYMTDAVDEYMIKHVRDFDKKQFTQISSENVKFKDEDEDLMKRREKSYTKKFKPLTKWLRKLYQGTVLRVQVAKRGLGSIPAIVTSSDFGNSANMERILRAQAFQHGADARGMMAMRIFELNPRHPIVLQLLEGCPPEEEGESEEQFVPSQATIDAAWMLHDMAMLNGGFSISNPDDHNKRLMKVLQKEFKLETLTLEPEIDPPVEEDEPPEFDMGGMGGLNMDDFNMGNMGDMGDFNFDDLDLDSMKA